MVLFDFSLVFKEILLNSLLTENDVDCCRNFKCCECFCWCLQELFSSLNLVNLFLSLLSYSFSILIVFQNVSDGFPPINYLTLFVLDHLAEVWASICSIFLYAHLLHHSVSLTTLFNLIAILCFRTYCVWYMTYSSSSTGSLKCSAHSYIENMNG